MTPHIDRVLHCYQHRAKGKREGVRGRVERGGKGGASSSSTVHTPSKAEGGGYESRLMQLERQLSQLLQKSKVKTSTLEKVFQCMAPYMYAHRLLEREVPIPDNRTPLVSHVSHDTHVILVSQLY